MYKSIIIIVPEGSFFTMWQYNNIPTHLQNISDILCKQQWQTVHKQINVAIFELWEEYESNLKYQA